MTPSQDYNTLRYNGTPLCTEKMPTIPNQSHNTDSISSNLTKTFNLNFIDHLKRILIYHSNRIVTEINVIYTNTKLVSVWDPMAHLK